MENECELLKELEPLIAKYEEQKAVILTHFTSLVSTVLSGEVTEVEEIEDIMDRLLDFGDDERFLTLYKKLSRHIYPRHPQMVTEHINLYRTLYEDNDDA